MWLVSSPMGQSDFHARSFDAGPSDVQFVDWFPTWEATPLLSEADTRALEPDERTWQREYAAVPSDDITDHWFGSAIESAIDIARRGPKRIYPDVTYTVAIDQAFQSDRFGYAVVSSEMGDPVPPHMDRPPRITTVHEAGAWKPDRSPREMARRLLNDVCSRYRTDRAFADQHSGLAFKELARDVGLNLEIVNWTSTGDESKSERFKAVRLAMYEGTFRLPDDPDLLRELRSVRGTILPSGGERIEVPRSSMGHGDRVSALVLGGSVALANPAQLSPSRMTAWEKIERKRQERELVAAIHLGGGDCLYF